MQIDTIRLFNLTTHHTRTFIKRHHLANILRFCTKTKENSETARFIVLENSNNEHRFANVGT